MPPAAGEESPAIRKLGALFRLTEVHLWDDSYVASAANGGQKHWRSAEDALADSQTDKMRNRTSRHTDEGHSFVEDLELANLMGSMGLPVSFRTSKVKKSTANKGKKKETQVPCEAVNTQTDDAVRICINTEDRESDVAVLEHTNLCNSTGTALGHYKSCHDDSDQMSRENQCELGTFKLPDNMGNPEKAESPSQENQGADSEMLDHNSLDSESRHSCIGTYQDERLSTREDRMSAEILSVPRDNNDVDREACLSLAEPSSVDEHTESCSNHIYYDYGDWTVIWDPFYSRYYFCNIHTQESTWRPPEGLEDFASYGSTATTEELAQLGSHYTSIAVQENNQAGDDTHLDTQGNDHRNELHDLSKIPGEEQIDQSMITTIHEAQLTEDKHNDSTTEVLGMDQEAASTKKKKRVRRSHSYHSCQDLAGNISNDIIKYWTQRYSLFSLFDSGIKMDEEGWFSVTPEPIAKHHAFRVGTGVMIDCFTGVGGNAIQFATKCKHVIAVDIDPQKIDCAHHNASVYGVNDDIDFIVDDFIRIAPHLKGETAFMSPPWGGPDYAKVDIYDMEAMLKPCDGYSLFKLGTMIASRVVMFLPRNIDVNQLADMSLSVNPPWAVEVEKNYLNGKLKAITAYFAKQDG